MTHKRPTHTALPHQAAQREFVICGHTTLFLWWPVWAVGLADSDEVARPYFDFNAPMISPRVSSKRDLNFARIDGLPTFYRVSNDADQLREPGRRARAVNLSETIRLLSKLGST